MAEYFKKTNLSDLKWLKDNFPLLEIKTVGKDVVEIYGMLDFVMDYDNEDKKYDIFPKGDIPWGIRIRDSYKIKVLFDKKNDSLLPQVFETDSRISSFAKAKDIPQGDLHINGDGSACLCVVGREKELFPKCLDIKTFFNKLLIPFFYQQSYFQKYNEWPWGQHAHGVLGLIERYGEFKNHDKEDTVELFNNINGSDEWFLLKSMLKKRKNIKDYKKCICGSGKKFRDCHPSIIVGLLNLKNDLIRYLIPHQNIS